MSSKTLIGANSLFIHWAVSKLIIATLNKQFTGGVGTSMVLILINNPRAKHATAATPASSKTIVFIFHTHVLKIGVPLINQLFIESTKNKIAHR